MTIFWKQLLQISTNLVFLSLISVCQPLPQEGNYYKISLPSNQPSDSNKVNDKARLLHVLDSAKASASDSPKGSDSNFIDTIEDIPTRILNLMIKLLGDVNPRSDPSEENATRSEKPTPSNPVAPAAAPPMSSPPTTTPISHQIECRHLQSLQPTPPNNYGWVAPSPRQDIPQGAFVAGEEKQDGGEIGHLIYIARGSFNGSIIPGKAVPGHLAAYVAVDSKEMPVFKYEVFVYPDQFLDWIDIDVHGIPSNAIVGGHHEGNPILVGRALFEAQNYYGNYNSNMEVGAFYPDRNELEITYKYRAYWVKNGVQILAWRMCEEKLV